MRVEWLVIAAVLSGCAVGGEPAIYGEEWAPVVERPARLTPVDDWERLEQPWTETGARTERLGGYWEGTLCFPFGTEGARCGGDNTVRVSEGETQTFTLSGRFSPPHSGTSFELSTSTRYTTTTSVTFRGVECQYCWPFVCYATKVQDRQRRVRGVWTDASERVTFSDPVVRRLCEPAERECGCIDAGTSSDASATVDAGPSDAGAPDAGADAGG